MTDNPINIGGREFSFPDVDQNDYPWASHLREILSELGERVAPEYICRQENDLQMVLGAAQAGSLIRVDQDQVFTGPQKIAVTGITLFPKHKGVTVTGTGSSAFIVEAEHFKCCGFRFNGFNDLAFFTEGIVSADLSGNQY